MKALNVQILDIRELTQIADYFVIASGISDRQVRALGDAIRADLRETGATRIGSEGEAAGGWILLDYVDVIVHVFNEDARAFYQLELLWGDAPLIEWQDAEAATKPETGPETVPETEPVTEPETVPETDPEHE